MDNFNGATSGFSDTKTAIMRQVQQEAAVNNARSLISVWSPSCVSPVSMPSVYLIAMCSQKLNSHCFDKCIPSPGSSLSSREEKCLTTCMEKYMATWNTVSRQYIGRIQKTAGEGMGGGGDMGGFGM